MKCGVPGRGQAQSDATGLCLPCHLVTTNHHQPHSPPLRETAAAQHSQADYSPLTLSFLTVSQHIEGPRGGKPSNPTLPHSLTIETSQRTCLYHDPYRDSRAGPASDDSDYFPSVGAESLAFFSPFRSARRLVLPIGPFIRVKRTCSYPPVARRGRHSLIMGV